VPLSRTVFESLRRTNKKLFFSLVALSLVATMLLVAVTVSTFSQSRGNESEAVVADRTEDQVEQLAPGVVSRAAPGVTQQKRSDVVVTEPAQRVESADSIAQAKARAELRARKAKVADKIEPAEAPVEKIEAPPPEPKKIAPYPDLRRQLALLRASSSRDSNTYYRLLGGIETAMSSLPPAAQKRIQSELNAAQLTYDVDAIGRALEELMKARADAS
jgi:hypothetical protein